MSETIQYADMKDSGFIWLGSIPSHWKTTRMKEIFQNITDKGHPDAEVLSLYREYGVLPKNSRDDNHNITSKDTGSYKYVQVGDLVINKMKAWQGSLGVSDYAGIVSPAYYVCHFRSEKFSKKYFHYLLRCRAYAQEFEKLSTGMRVGQWDLNIDDFMTVPAVVPLFEEQQAIASFLDTQCAQIDAAIAEAKVSIEEYKEWKGAVIFEVTTKGLQKNVPMKNSGVEWIGNIPSSWKIAKIKHVAEFMPKINLEGLHDDSIVTFTPMECIRTGTFVNRKQVYKEIKGSYTQYANGDIVLAKVTPCFENGNACVMNDLYSGIGFGSSELFVLRPQKINAFYLLYILLNHGFKQVACSTMTGTGGLKRVSSAFIQNCYIPLPDSDTQNLIVDYLNRNFAEVNSVVSEKESLIVDLETYKRSLIYETVTGKRKVV